MPVSVTRYTDLNDSSSMEKIELPNLSMHIQYFALANFQNRSLFLSGGRDNQFTPSDRVYAFDLRCEMWHDEPVPRLNEARCGHSSSSLGSNIYVFCGNGVSNKTLNSIERLDIG